MAKSEERIKLIGSTILEQATRDSDEIRALADSRRDASLRQFEDALIDEMFLKIRREISKIHRDSAAARSAVWREAHRELYGRRQSLEEAILQAVRQRLLAYTQTTAYRDNVRQRLESLVDKYDHSGSVVSLSARDEDLTSIVHAVMGHACQVIADSAIRLGGFTLRIPTAGILLDHTLDSCLTQARVWLLEHSGLQVL